MKVKLLSSRAGLDFAQAAGEVIEVGDDEGLRMIEAGQAVAATDPVIETAVPKTAKKTATPAVAVETAVAKPEVETAAGGADTVAGDTAADTVAGGDA